MDEEKDPSETEESEEEKKEDEQQEEHEDEEKEREEQKEEENDKDKNFRKLREENERLRKSASGVDIEQIQKEARIAAKLEMISGEVDNFLAQYDADAKQVVKHYFDKLTAGEDVTLQNVSTFMRQAENAANSNSENPIQRIYNSSRGQAAKMQPSDGSSKIDGEKVDGVARNLNLQYIKDKDKKE